MRLTVNPRVVATQSIFVGSRCRPLSTTATIPPFETRSRENRATSITGRGFCDALPSIDSRSDRSTNFDTDTFNPVPIDAYMFPTPRSLHRSPRAHS